MRSLLRKSLFSSLFLFTALSVTQSCADEKVTKQAQKFDIPEFANVYSTESTFEDAKADLLEAIEDNGLVISYTSHAENMLANTAEVSGVTKAVYENAEILLFCKADLSHALVAANPHNIVLCPYSIAIYVLNGESEKVYLSYRSFQTLRSKDENIKSLTKPIEDLLKKIIEEVI